MKTNTYLILILFIGPVLLLAGAGLAVALTAFVAGSLLGVVIKDYSASRSI